MWCVQADYDWGHSRERRKQSLRKMFGTFDDIEGVRFMKVEEFSPQAHGFFQHRSGHWQTKVEEAE